MLLLIVNAAYYAWELHREIDAARRSERVTVIVLDGDPGEERTLVLLGELEQKPPLKRVMESLDPSLATPLAEGTDRGLSDGGEVLEDDDVEAGVSKPLSCLFIGPFQEARDYADLHAWLSERQVPVVIESRRSEGAKRYWVYLPSFSSASDAQATLADLKDKGIQDVLVIRQGDTKNAISLGLFSTQGSVDRRFAELKTHGYEPQVLTRQRMVDRDWLVVAMEDPSFVGADIPVALLGNAAMENQDCGVGQ